MIHEAESCTIVYYRREDGGRREDRTAAAIPKTHSPPSALLSRPAAPSVPLCCHECRGLARAFNVSTESEPMTGRNRDAETMLPFSHLNESPLPPPPVSLSYPAPLVPAPTLPSRPRPALASARAILASLASSSFLRLLRLLLFSAVGDVRNR